MAVETPSFPVLITYITVLNSSEYISIIIFESSGIFSSSTNKSKTHVSPSSGLTLKYPV